MGVFGGWNRGPSGQKRLQFQFDFHQMERVPIYFMLQWQKLRKRRAIDTDDTTIKTLYQNTVILWFLLNKSDMQIQDEVLLQTKMGCHIENLYCFDQQQYIQINSLFLGNKGQQPQRCGDCGLTQLHYTLKIKASPFTSFFRHIFRRWLAFTKHSDDFKHTLDLRFQMKHLQTVSNIKLTKDIVFAVDKSGLDRLQTVDHHSKRHPTTLQTTLQAQQIPNQTQTNAQKCLSHQNNSNQLSSIFIMVASFEGRFKPNGANKRQQVFLLFSDIKLEFDSE